MSRTGWPLGRWSKISDRPHGGHRFGIYIRVSGMLLRSGISLARVARSGLWEPLAVRTMIQVDLWCRRDVGKNCSAGQKWTTVVRWRGLHSHDFWRGQDLRGSLSICSFLSWFVVFKYVLFQVSASVVCLFCNVYPRQQASKRVLPLLSSF